MRKYYKISEISKLYGISVDSLRYYERLGVLNPKRGENNYRLYSLNDLYKLNIIRELRPLNFSVQSIKDYLEDQTIEKTLELFSEEAQNIKQQIKELKSIERSLKERTALIRNYQAQQANQFEIVTLPARPCVMLNTDIQRDEEADFAIQRLHIKYEARIYDLGKRPIGSTLSKQEVLNGIYGHFNTIFYILEQSEEHEYLLPAGEYISYYYRGDYTQSSDEVLKLLDFAQNRGYSLSDDVYEIYHIDNRYTVKPSEFLTEIQARIIAKG